MELDPPAVGRLNEIRVPTFTILGDLDEPDIHYNSDLILRDIP